MSSAVSLAAALDHLDRGFALLPVRAAGKEPNYRVLRAVHGSPRWELLHHEPASPEQVRAWHEVDPRTNIGVILGEPSCGLVVPDFDRTARGVTHPPTPIVQAGRGYHVHLRAEGPISTQNFAWGELRGDGSYVLLPDSVHPSGKQYFYILSHDDVAVANVTELRLEGNSACFTKTRDQGCTGTTYEMPVYPSGTGIEELAKSPQAVRQALPILGIHVELGKSFRCILPGHNERRPSASIYRDPLTGLH